MAASGWPSARATAHDAPVPAACGEDQLEAVPVNELRRACEDLDAVLERPQWDFTQYCRRLAERLDGDGSLTAAALARLAEELIEDLRQGLDRRTGKPFRSVMLNDRGELIYDYCRQQLVEVAGRIADRDFASALEAGLSVTPPPAVGEAPKAAPAKAPQAPSEPQAKAAASGASKTATGDAAVPAPDAAPGDSGTGGSASPAGD
ncbi:MAG: hypothetical protein PVF43_00505 [Candidatus Eiseniibacteriota bacterium]